jgi:hypothetical protein
MRLAPREAEKLALHNAGFLAQKRLARGLRLNYTEAVALIAAQVSERTRTPPPSPTLPPVPLLLCSRSKNENSSTFPVRIPAKSTRTSAFIFTI